MVHIGFSAPKEFKEQFTNWYKSKGYTTESEALRDLVRRAVGNIDLSDRTKRRALREDILRQNKIEYEKIMGETDEQ